jgi:negative regulator of flagellin synthesis FlgM
MASEETEVIDSVGKAQPPRAPNAVGEALSRAARPLGEAGAVAAASAVQSGIQGPASSSLAQVAKDLAASPPVDTAKVERLRAAIISGDYRADPAAIATKMMALESLPAPVESAPPKA